MIGTTLADIRSHIEGLASETGDYYLVCARYGDRPVPTSGLRFESRPVAAAAARAVEQYRSELRRYDPQLPYYDIVVCQSMPSNEGRTHRSGPLGCCADDDPSWGISNPVVTGPDGPNDDLIEFCHRVAATVFETLSAGPYSAVESAVMDAYFEAAERLTSPDGLCLCLLERMAVELAGSLSIDEQLHVLSQAAIRLNEDLQPTGPMEAVSVSEALAGLQSHGILGAYSHSLEPAESVPEGMAHRVSLRDYALSADCGRLPLLPVLIELHRHGREWVPSGCAQETPADEWIVELVPINTVDSSTVVSEPIAPEVL